MAQSPFTSTQQFDETHINHKYDEMNDQDETFSRLDDEYNQNELKTLIILQSRRQTRNINIDINDADIKRPRSQSQSHIGDVNDKEDSINEDEVNSVQKNEQGLIKDMDPLLITTDRIQEKGQYADSQEQEENLISPGKRSLRNQRSQSFDISKPNDHYNSDLEIRKQHATKKKINKNQELIENDQQYKLEELDINNNEEEVFSESGDIQLESRLFVNDPKMESDQAIQSSQLQSNTLLNPSPSCDPNIEPKFAKIVNNEYGTPKQQTQVPPKISLFLKNISEIVSSTIKTQSFSFQFNNNANLSFGISQGFRYKSMKKIKLLYEGWIFIKQDGLLSLWNVISYYILNKIFLFQKQWAVLTDDKLYLFVDEQKERKIQTFTFFLTKCIFKLEKNIINVIIPDFKRKFFLKAEYEHESKNLYEKIHFTVKVQGRGQSIDPICVYLYIFMYHFSDVMTEREFLKQAETGDIILLETDHIGAALQRKITGSTYGIVIRFSLNDVRIYDSNIDTGVTLLPWDVFIEENDLYCRAAIRKLHYHDKYEAFPIFMNLIGETLGKKYHIHLTQLLKKKSTSSDDQKKFTQTDLKGYFCSQLVAKVYKRIGLLPKRISSCQFLPVTFTERKNLKLLKGARLCSEQVILLDRHRKYQKL